MLTLWHSSDYDRLFNSTVRPKSLLDTIEEKVITTTTIPKKKCGSGRRKWSQTLFSFIDDTAQLNATNEINIK